MTGGQERGPVVHLDMFDAELTKKNTSVLLQPVFLKQAVVNPKTLI